MNGMKQWRCKEDHILGFIRWNGDGTPQLMVLRKALDMDAEMPSEVDLVGPVTGSMPIRCSICNSQKLWAVSVDTMLALFESLSDKQAYEFWLKLLERAKTPLSAKQTSPQIPLRGYLEGEDGVR